MVIQLLVNGLIAGCVYALVALGFGLVYNTTRFFHFAHGAVYMVGAYTVFCVQSFLILDAWGSWGFFISIPLAVILASALGGAIELGIYRPMRKRGASPLTLLLASLGIYVVIQNIIAMIFGNQPQTIRTFPIKVGLNFLGAKITPIQIAIILTSIALVSLTWLIIKRTKWGKAMRAVANDSELSKIKGINSDSVILLTFLAASALAACAAILISLDVDISPTMGFNALLMGVIAVIVGGIGSIPGALLGGLLIGLAQNLGVLALPCQWQDAIAFSILLLFLIFRPQGFLGKKLGKAEL